jgi:ADP-ribose pyrophosphatase YjhB (NUDIX family)
VFVPRRFVIAVSLFNSNSFFVIRELPPTGALTPPSPGGEGIWQTEDDPLSHAIELRTAAIVVRDGRILLVNHRKHDRSYWVLPGGHVEKGETLSAALAREMEEELALPVVVGPLVIVHDFITKKRHVVNHVFRADAAADDFRLGATHTLVGARWVALEELGALDLLPPITETLRRVIDGAAAGPVYLGAV